MTIAALIVFGLCLGSFVNALVWRLRQQETTRGKKQLKDLSIAKGRSMCPHCKHTLSTADLVPVLSWMWLRGKCRYCKKPIGVQYPLVELLTAVLFVISYLFWPMELAGWSWLVFVLWLVIVAGMVSLVVYDLKWMILPNRIVFPLIGVAVVLVVLRMVITKEWGEWYDIPLSLAISSGLFYLLFQVSGGKWIGGGDVKLGLFIGLLLADPFMAFLMLFVASMLGTLFVLPIMMTGRLKPTSRIPFGPFLLIATYLVVLYGARIAEWYGDFALI